MANFKLKKFLFGIPSLFSVGITFYLTFVYYFKLFPELKSINLTFLGYLLMILHTFLAVMTIWSLLKTLLSNPGYISQSLFKDQQEGDIVRQLNHKLYKKNHFLRNSKNEKKSNDEQIEEDLSSDSSDELDVKTTKSAINDIESKPTTVTDEQWKLLEDEVDQRFDQQTRSYIRFRFCYSCNQVKPPRTHHCQICDACVLRMDHHCPWVGNCVGMHNHKYFWNFLFWAFLGTAQVALTLVITKGFSALSQDIMYMVAVMLAIAFSISIVSLLAMHTYMILKNLSTIELAALDKRNPFNKGNVWDNAKLVMGDDWRYWLVPVTPKDRFNGIDWTIVPSH